MARTGQPPHAASRLPLALHDNRHVPAPPGRRRRAAAAAGPVRRRHGHCAVPAGPCPALAPAQWPGPGVRVTVLVALTEASQSRLARARGPGLRLGLGWPGPRAGHWAILHELAARGTALAQAVPPRAEPEPPSRWRRCRRQCQGHCPSQSLACRDRGPGPAAAPASEPEAPGPTRGRRTESSGRGKADSVRRPPGSAAARPDIISAIFDFILTGYSRKKHTLDGREETTNARELFMKRMSSYM